MPRCIYCQEDRPAASYTKAEHVLPQSFGTFRHNFTLRGVVCDLCNQYFGDHLELYLARDTLEGQMRFKHGLKRADEFKSVGQGGRVVVRSTEGQFAGCYMLRYYSEEKNDIAVRPVPQVGFMLAAPRGYRYFQLDEIPTQAELDQMSFDAAHARPIVGLAIDPEELARRLAEKGIPFRYGGDLKRDTDVATIACELDVSVDPVIIRAVAKIAFNYVAYWQGAEFVQHAAFDSIRRYVRWGNVPDQKLIDMDENAILVDEPIEGQRRLGHVITVNWAADGVSVLAQVSLCNWMTYRICLSPDFSGPPPELAKGHFFNLPGREIIELGHGQAHEAPRCEPDRL